MPTRLLKIIILFLVIGLCVYFVSINTDSITVSIAPGNQVKASVGTIVLSSFAFGILLAFIAASVFALRSFFRELGFKRREQKRILLEQQILEAREISLTESFDQAKKRWQRLIHQHPDSQAVHLSYCSFLLDNESYQDAVIATDDAKQLFRDSVEIHLLAAKVQEKIGNKTASLDNLAIVLSKKPLFQPTIEAAKLSYSLNRFEDTLEYIERASDLAAPTEEIKRLKADSLAGIIIRDRYQDDERKEALLTHLVSYPNSVAALSHISELQINFGEVNEAAQSQWRIFKLTGDINALRQARSIWLSGGYAESAVSAVKSFARESQGEQSWLASLELAKTYLLLSRDNEAAILLDKLYEQSYSKEINNAKELAILRAMIAYRAKDHHASALAFQTVERLELGLNHSSTQLKISSL